MQLHRVLPAKASPALLALREVGAAGSSTPPASPRQSRATLGHALPTDSRLRASPRPRHAEGSAGALAQEAYQANHRLQELFAAGRSRSVAAGSSGAASSLGSQKLSVRGSQSAGPAELTSPYYIAPWTGIVEPSATWSANRSETANDSSRTISRAAELDGILSEICSEKSHMDKTLALNRSASLIASLLENWQSKRA